MTDQIITDGPLSIIYMNVTPKQCWKHVILLYILFQLKYFKTGIQMHSSLYYRSNLLVSTWEFQVLCPLLK